MDEPPADPLLAFAYGTFHAAFLMVALVLLAQRTGALPGVLSTLDTISGLALFGALWGASVFAMWRAIVDKAPAGSLAMRGTSWGAAVGVVFLVAAIAVSSVKVGLSPALFFPLAFGSVFAAGVGAFVGLAFVGIDALLAWSASRIGKE